MNRLFLILKAPLLLVLYASLAFSAPPEEMNEEQMQQLYENAQKMQECYAQIDHQAMDALAVKGNRIHHEIKALCEDGNHEEAQEKAAAYGKEMASSDAMQALQKCGENINLTIQQMVKLDYGENGKAEHVCDGM
jgi:hypothetical protein